jgi:multidrug efflux pump
VADVHRGFNDPPAPRMRFMGEDAIGLAVAMKDGGDILVLGKALEGEFAACRKTSRRACNCARCPTSRRR